MHQEDLKIKRALISVSDKTGIVAFAKKLVASGVEIISTGGTASLLRDNGVVVIDVSEVTQFSEMMGGRVKTLHPMIHGGILGLRDSHSAAATEHGIGWIDLVVCNLYPFEKTVTRGQVDFDSAVENIDIGGPSMVRAAAKNMGWVTVVVDVDDYGLVVDSLEVGVSFSVRKQLAIKAFRHTAYYDTLICQHFSDEAFPTELTIASKKVFELRYGENPHQAASIYIDPLCQSPGLLNAKQHQGKALSYNNIADGDGALRCVAEYTEPACVIVKHANPCGVAVAESVDLAFKAAFNADSQSAFGGIVAFNKPVTAILADELVKIFFEIIIAPGFDEVALQTLSQKQNLRVLELSDNIAPSSALQIRSVTGGLLVQDHGDDLISENELSCVTAKKVTEDELKNLMFAWKTVKHVKSNAILIAKDGVTLGVGPGQVSRVGAVEIAVKKTPQDQIAGAVLASDAFFPFRDSIDAIAEHGITAIIQPGGSRRDDEVIAACDEHGIAMVFTGKRCFYH